MNDTNNGMTCVIGCWLCALVAGIIVAALAMVLGGFGFTPAAFFGLLVFVLVGAFLSFAMCRGEAEKHGANASAALPAGSNGTATVSASSDVVAQDSGNTSDANGATAAATASVQADEVAKAPAAAKPAAKKPAAKKAAAKPAKKPAAKADTKPVAKDGKPELLTAARAGGADDLKQIKGVGPKMEGMLNTMGVYHFDQVASWRKAEVQWVDDNLDGFKGRVSRDEWVKQAKVLAKGGTTEFSKKVDKGGVY
jgi:predicted flap endonuclease-1-like 5' DNA nuclease